MGTDIHLIIEYQDSAGIYHSLTQGVFHLPRDYRVFAALAGVRSETAGLIEVRGFPDDASWDAHGCYYHRVSEFVDPGHSDGHFLLEPPDNARRAVEQGLSNFKTYLGLELVSDPDAHHATWLTSVEFRESLKYAGVKLDSLAIEYRIVIEALERVAANNGRSVMWFDS